MLVIALWLAFTAGWRPLSLPDEGRYAGVAWEMVNAGNWLVPLLDGMPFFHKPPLFYWITAASLSTFGVSEWSARLAPLLIAIAAAGGLYFFLLRYRSERMAALGAAILVTQPFYFAGAQFANLDMPVAGMIALTILSGADAALRFERGTAYRGAALRTFALAGLAVLAKGLIGIVLPGGVLLVWLLWSKSWRATRLLAWLPGWAAFLAVALPWMGWMQHLYPEFFNYFVVYQHFQRFAEAGFNNRMPIWFYVPVVLVFALPWSAWIVRLCNKAYWRDPAHGALRRLMAVWFLLILAFFSLPNSKPIGYIMPVLPPFAYFVADAFEGWFDVAPARARRWFAISFASAVVACLALVGGVALSESLTAKDLVQARMAGFAPEDQLVVVGKYQYDLGFYLKAKRTPWVVDRWNDPEIRRNDNWRKELWDAGQFDPATAQVNLLLPQEFTERLCRYRGGDIWIWAESGNAKLLPWLQAQAPTGSDANHEIWRLRPADIPALAVCRRGNPGR